MLCFPYISYVHDQSPINPFYIAQNKRKELNNSKYEHNVSNGSKIVVHGIHR